MVTTRSRSRHSIENIINESNGGTNQDRNQHNYDNNNNNGNDFNDLTTSTTSFATQSGMSIIGLNNDDDDVDESLLLSPILAEYYIPPKTAMSSQTKKKTPKQSLESQPSSILSLSFQSPTVSRGTKEGSTAPSTKESAKTVDNMLSPPPSSHSYQLRSSARLRRRRDALFVSPTEEQFEKNNQDEIEHQNEDDEGTNSRPNSRQSYERRRSSSDRMNKLLLLRGALDTSCLSLGLDSSISEGSKVDDDHNHDHEFDDHNFDNRNKNHDDHKHQENQNESPSQSQNYQRADTGIRSVGRTSIGSSSSSRSNGSRRKSQSGGTDLEKIITEDENGDGDGADINISSNQELSSSSLSNKSIEDNEHIVMTENHEFENHEQQQEHEQEYEQDLEHGLEHGLEHEQEEEQNDDISFDSEKDHDELEEEDQNDDISFASNSTSSKGSHKNHVEDDVVENFTIHDEFISHQMNIVESSDRSIAKTRMTTTTAATTKTPTKDATTDVSTHSIQMTQTPPRPSSSSSSDTERKSLSLTPKLREAARQTLTPVFKALRSKLMRDKRTESESEIEIDVKNDEKIIEWNDEKEIEARAPAAQADMTTARTTDYDMNDLEQSVSLDVAFKSPSTEHIPEEASTSITPALRRLRSKLYHGLSNDLNSPHNKEIDNGSTVDEMLPNEESILTCTYDDEMKAHTLETEKTLDEVEEHIDMKTPKTPSNSDNLTGLSITPVLKAFRSKLLGSSSIKKYSSQKFMDPSVSPIYGSSPNTTNNTTPRRGFLYSPPLRESTLSKTPKTTSEKNQSHLTVDGDDSYFAQPKDLSSAKKNLNAQSSALVERLRGAAQRRMVHLTKKRDSLAAKESKLHISPVNEIIEDMSETKNESEGKKSVIQSKTNPRKTQFKARPYSSTAKVGGGINGVPNIIKKSTTKAISPKLGIRRQEKSNVQDTINKTESQQKDPFYISPFKARPVPTFRDKDGSKIKSGVPNVKRRPLTTPLSPMLGPKRNSEKHRGSRKQITQAKKKSNQFYGNKKESLSPDPVGLGFLSKTPDIRERENIPPIGLSTGFQLHSTMRAKNRAKFDTSFALRERQREKQKRLEASLLIKQRLVELETLKKSLR